MASTAGGELNFFAQDTTTKMAFTAQFLYGYGYSAPFSEFLERPVDCSIDDLFLIFDDYEFLENPDPSTDKSLLIYYTTELNVDIKRKLFCIVSIWLVNKALFWTFKIYLFQFQSKKKDSNQEAREFFGLLDLYISVLQEIFSA